MTAGGQLLTKYNFLNYSQVIIEQEKVHQNFALTFRLKFKIFNSLQFHFLKILQQKHFAD